MSNRISSAALPTSQTVLSAPNQTLDITGTSNLTFAATGSNDRITSIYDNADTVTLGGPDEAYLSVGFPGNNDHVVVSGTGDTVAVGLSTIDLYGDRAFVTVLDTHTGDSPFTFGGGTVTAHGAGSDTVQGGGGAFVFHGDSGRYSVSGGTAVSATIDGGSGGGLFIGGQAAPLFGPFNHRANNMITAGAERSTLVGSAYGTSVLTAKGSAGGVLQAGEFGQDTLSGGTSNGRNLLEGYQGPQHASTDPHPVRAITFMQAGQGNDTLVAGIGATTMVGGTGQDVFRFINNPALGTATVLNGFVHGPDLIDLRGFAGTTNDILSSATFAAGGTTLSLGNGATVTVSGVTLTAADITRTG